MSAAMGGGDAVAAGRCRAATGWVDTTASTSRAAVADSSAGNIVDPAGYGAFASSQIAAIASAAGASSRWPSGYALTLSR